MRNFGLGLSNAFSRIGGLLSPFVAVQARQLSWQYAPEAIFAALSLVAAGLVFLLPHDKKGERQLRHMAGRLVVIHYKDYYAALQSAGREAWGRV